MFTMLSLLFIRSSWIFTELFMLLIVRCRHEFCYSCGAEYRNGQQTCQCAFWDEDNNNTEDLVTQSMQESEQWAWETFNSLPMIMDAYSDQERSQLALIQRFLAGGFSLSDHPPYQSPPRCTDSYVDAMKDLHQLPWLERFVSVISDNYYEEYIQWIIGLLKLENNLHSFPPILFA